MLYCQVEAALRVSKNKTKVEETGSTNHAMTVTVHYNDLKLNLFLTTSTFALKLCSDKQNCNDHEVQNMLSNSNFKC